MNLREKSERAALLCCNSITSIAHCEPGQEVENSEAVETPQSEGILKAGNS